MVDNVTNTGIDALLKYINEHGETDVLNLSKVFRVDVSVVEQWANILENAHMVKISYKLDKMFVAPLGMTKEDIKAMSAEVEVRRRGIAADIKSKEVLLTNIEDKINKFTKFTEDAEKVFKKNAGSVKKTLDELHELRKKANDEYDSVRSNKEYLDKLSKKMDQDIAAVRARADMLKKIDPGAEGAKKLVDDAKSKIRLVEADKSAMEKKFEEDVAVRRKEIAELSGSVDAQVRTLRSMIAQQEKLVDENSRAVINYGKEAERIIKEIDKKGDSARDRANKAMDAIGSLYTLADKKTKTITGEVDDYISKFGELATIDSTIRGMREGLEKAKKDCEYCKQQFMLINTQLKEIESNQKLGVDEKNTQIKDISGKVDEIDKRIEGINNDVESSGPDKLDAT